MACNVFNNLFHLIIIIISHWEVSNTIWSRQAEHAWNTGGQQVPARRTQKRKQVEMGEKSVIKCSQTCPQVSSTTPSGRGAAPYPATFWCLYCRFLDSNHVGVTLGKLKVGCLPPDLLKPLCRTEPFWDFAKGHRCICQPQTAPDPWSHEGSWCAEQGKDSITSCSCSLPPSSCLLWIPDHSKKQASLQLCSVLAIYVTDQDSVGPVLRQLRERGLAVANLTPKGP